MNYYYTLKMKFIIKINNFKKVNIEYLAIFDKN